MKNPKCSSRQFQARPARSVRHASPVKLENLEQRILLAGDVAVIDPLASSGRGMEVQALDSSSVPVGQVVDTGDASSLPRPNAQPLEIIAPSGNTQLVRDLVETSAPLALPAGYTLVGSGELSSSLINQGVVAPGASPGLLSLQGFEQTATGVLKLEIGGLNAGAGIGDPLDGYDQIGVAGRAVLAGTLSLDFINDFRPVAGQVFDVIKWSERSGAFSAYTGLYAGNGLFLKPVYQANGLQLVATALPGLADLSIASLPAAQGALDDILSGMANGVAKTGISFDASIELAGVRLAGSWDVSLALQPAGGVETTFVARDVSANWSSGGLSGALSKVSGSLVVAADQSVLALSGTGQMTLPGGDGLSGNFVISGDAASGLLNVAATDVSARIGDPARGAALTLANAGLVMSLGSSAYAMQASGQGSLQGAPGSSFSGTLSYVANTFGRSVDVSFAQGGANYALKIDGAEQVNRFEARAATLTLADLGHLVGDFVFASRSETNASTQVQELVIGARNFSADLALGDLSLQAGNGWLWSWRPPHR